jgi:hypothetical protein
LGLSKGTTIVLAKNEKKEKIMYIKIKSTRQMRAQVNKSKKKQMQTINQKKEGNKPMQMEPMVMK